MSTEVSRIPSNPQVLVSLSDDLTNKQKLFIYYYLETRNATKSAKLAGYGGDENSLAVIGSDNLRKPKIKEVIESYYETRIMSANNVLAELSDVGNAPWRDFVEVKMGEGEVISAQLRLGDKLRALELMGKHHRVITDRVETETSINESDSERLADQLAQSLLAAISRKQLENKE